jgi:diguanylate cyclase (GGDEF)-like protein
MNSETERVYRALQQSYLTEAPARLVELRKEAEAFRAGERDAVEWLRTRLHRLAGAAAAHGLPDVSGVARDLENWLAEAPAAAPETSARLQDGLNALSVAFDAAGRVLDPVGETPRQAEFGWRALVAIESGLLRERAIRALWSAGFDVHVADLAEPDTTSPSARPDLVVVAVTDAAGDPYAMTAAWTSSRLARPRAVVLIEAGGPIDRMRAVAAGADQILIAEQVDSELPRFARLMARIGSPPARVLIADADPVADAYAAYLMQAGVRVVQARSADEAQELFDAEVPDIVLLAEVLPDADGVTFAKLLRQDPRFHLVPIVLVAPARDIPEQIAALRAGADDFLSHPVDEALLLQLVVSRAERGRQLRELVHRDGLTGLLNHATLLAELEIAVEFARRSGNGFALLIADVDHFRRVNDRFGHLVGDQVLVHVGGLIRSHVRASDLVGRYGGEEFGLLLRGCTPEGAELVGKKVQQLIAETAAETRDGSVIPVTVSIGGAVYQHHGETAAEIIHAADRALHAAKAEGRDRVVFGA